ncbi:YjcZ family sporulation protein [Neobacillus sp. YX16]|nr:YjcZ family sporulation protein [Neobacillus sp. YX16]WHZ06062.1 YjcZ family sporulation protein [Neobacillus sp. YX16]
MVLFILLIIVLSSWC